MSLNSTNSVVHDATGVFYNDDVDADVLILLMTLMITVYLMLQCKC